VIYMAVRDLKKEKNKITKDQKTQPLKRLTIERESDVAITRMDLSREDDCHAQILIALVSLFMNPKYRVKMIQSNSLLNIDRVKANWGSNV